MENRLIVIILLNFVSNTVFCQYNQGTIVHETLVSASILNNQGGENASRHVAVYLPHDYQSTNKRFSVVYWLHGFGLTETDSIYYKMTEWQELIDKAIATKVINPIIMVFVDNTTQYWGSNYANSALTGNWEDLMSKEIVQHIDKRYRTLATNKSRAIAGYSMGGYGAMRIAMKHPDIFSSVYALSPAMGNMTEDFSITQFWAFENAANAKSKDELKGDFQAMALLAYGRTFTPNLNKPPFYCDLPLTFQNDMEVIHDDILKIWHDNTLSGLIDDNISGLRALKAIKFDWGRADIPYIKTSCRSITDKLKNYGISHIAEEFNGDHDIPQFTKDGPLLSEMLPFVALNLVF